MERGELGHEHIQADVIPEDILKMYKVEGYAGVEYESFLKSKNVFEAEVVHSDREEESQSSVEQTRNSILGHSGVDAAALILNALQSNDIEIQRVGASYIERVPENQRPSLRELADKKITEAISSQDIQVERIGMKRLQFASE